MQFNRFLKTSILAEVLLTCLIWNLILCNKKKTSNGKHAFQKSSETLGEKNVYAWKRRVFFWTLTKLKWKLNRIQLTSIGYCSGRHRNPVPNIRSREIQMTWLKGENPALIAKHQSMETQTILSRVLSTFFFKIIASTVRNCDGNLANEVTIRSWTQYVQPHALNT